MKKILVLIMIAQSLTAAAQTLSDNMQKVYEACMKLSASIGAGNTTGLRSANKQLKDCDVSIFSSLRIVDNNPLSLDGHFVFDEVFVDSLLAGRDVYKFAQRYADTRGVRGASSSGKIFTQTCAVRKSSSTTLSFVSRGHQELAVVAEPGGKISLRIHDKTHDKWYNDTKNVKKGESSRTFVFDLPTTERATLEVEIKNCGQKDCSFVVISN